MAMTRQQLEAMLQTAHEAKSSAGENAAAAAKIDVLVNALTQAISDLNVREAGEADAVKAAAKLLKNARRESLAYPWTDAEKRQVICDGFRVFRLTKHLPLPKRPAGKADDLDKLTAAMDKQIFGAIYGNAVKVPTASDLRAYISAKRAEYRAETTSAERRGKPFSCTWLFGKGLPAVNAEYLLDALTILGPGVEGYASLNCGSANPTVSLTGPVWLMSERGDGYLLPIRLVDHPLEKEQGKPAPATVLQNPEAFHDDKLAGLFQDVCIANYNVQGCQRNYDVATADLGDLKEPLEEAAFCRLARAAIMLDDANRALGQREAKVTEYRKALIEALHE